MKLHRDFFEGRGGGFLRLFLKHCTVFLHATVFVRSTVIVLLSGSDLLCYVLYKL